MLYSGKGLDLILECLRRLKEGGYSFTFKFVGGGMIAQEEYEAAFRKDIFRRNLQDEVEHLGLVADWEVSHWLSRSRFVFLPYDRGVSDRRGTLMAAIAHGRAVLTSPPAVEMPCFKNGVNICWPNQHAVGEYLPWMERLLRDDRLIERLETGARRLAPLFDWRQIVLDHELVLEHL
jgi:glycosyltransferase involved in cell wall biosynthesis